VPTPKQWANVLKRVERAKQPLPFPQARTDNFVSNKYGQATTHWQVAASCAAWVANPCPLVLIGLPASMVRFDASAVDVMGEDDAAPM